MSQQKHNAVETSFGRRHDVAVISRQRCYDVTCLLGMIQRKMKIKKQQLLYGEALISLNSVQIFFQNVVFNNFEWLFQHGRLMDDVVHIKKK